MLNDTYKAKIMRSHLLHKRLNNYRNFGLSSKNVYVQHDCDDLFSKYLLWNGIFHPRANQAYTNLDSYHQQFFQEEYPTVGIIFPCDEWVRGDTGYYSLLIEEIEKQGLNVIALFCPWFGNNRLYIPGVDETVKTYFYKNDLPVIDVLINCFEFSLTVRRPVSKEFLNKLGVPVLEGYKLLQSYKKWQALAEGTTSIEERIVQMARRARKWAILHQETNGNKKIHIGVHHVD